MAENKGTWLDHDTNKLVNSPPQRGTLIVSPDVEPNAYDDAALERAKAALEPESADAGDDAAAQTVTTRSTNRK